jgi:hypothetical protein
MPANTAAIFPLTPVMSWGLVETANTAKDGTGTQVTVYTAGANGSRVDRLKVRNTGTAVQTVLRVFINKGADPATPANNTLYMEQTIPACTLSETTAQTDIIIPLDIALPAGYLVNVAVGTTVAAELAVTCEGGDF